MGDESEVEARAFEKLSKMAHDGMQYFQVRELIRIAVAEERQACADLCLSKPLDLERLSSLPMGSPIRFDIGPRTAELIRQDILKRGK